MEDPDYSALVERYRSLPDEELLQILERKADLLPLARTVLDQEASRRAGRLEVLRRTQANDAVADEIRLERQYEIKQKKQARRFKWFLIVFVPVLVVMLIVDPVGTFKFLAPRVAIAAVVLGLWWGAFWIWQRYSARNAGKFAGDA